MNNYLTNLVTTRLQLTPTLQPRVAQLFEPTMSGEYNAGVRDLYTSVPNPEPVAAHSAPMEPALRPARALETPSDSGIHPAPTHLESIDRPRPLQAGPPALAPLPQVPLRSGDQESMVIHEISETRVKRDQVIESSNIAEPVYDTNAPAPVPSVKPMSPGPLPIVVQPHIRPIVETTQTEFAPNPSTAPSIIHVSIGRIEVRAPQTVTERVPQQRPAPNKMSLDEFLNRRERGER